MWWRCRMNNNELAALLARAREFFQDPENERAYQEWKAGKGAKR